MTGSLYLGNDFPLFALISIQGRLFPFSGNTVTPAAASWLERRLRASRTAVSTRETSPRVSVIIVTRENVRRKRAPSVKALNSLFPEEYGG